MSEIQSVEISFFIHDTEDKGRVLEAIGTLFSLSDPPRVEVLEGHFGNKIAHVRYHVMGEEATSLFEKVSSLLSHADAAIILGEISRNLDEHRALYLRFSKQEMMAGRMVPSEKDPVRVKVKPRAYMMKEDPATFYRRVMGMPK